MTSQRDERLGCVATFDDCVEKLRAGSVSAVEAADLLIDQLDDRELRWLLDGDVPVRELPGWRR